MADYTIVLVLVQDILPNGGLRVMRNGTVTIKSAATDEVLGTATPNQNGRAVFISPTPTIYYVTDNGFVSDHITAGSILEAAAAAALNNDAGVAALVNDTGSATRAGLNSTFARKGGLAINVTDGPYNAKGDGTTDDTAAIQSALDAAAVLGMPVYFPTATYSVSSIVPRAGVRMLTKGATLRANANVGEGVIAPPLGTAVDDWTLDGFTIDCNNITRRGVFSQGSRVSIINNTVFGLSSTTVSACGIRLYFGSSDCTVADNDVTLGTDSPFGTFASLTGIHLSGNQNGIYAGLDTNNDVVQGSQYLRRNIITKNRVSGGTHGIVVSAAEQNLVQGNYLEYQSHRNIILSPEASFNDISSNMCRQFGSAAIHIAYGSNGNHVHGNTIYSDGTFLIGATGGEGAIQVYVHCQDNRIFGNRIRSKSTRYGVYTAIYCNGTAIEGNDIEWTLLGGIAVESDWFSTHAAGELYARPNYTSPPNPAWTSWDNGKGMTQVSVRNNRVRRSQTGVVNVGVYVSQVAAASLSNVTVEGNLIDSQNTSGHDFYVFCADATKLTATSVRDNTVQPDQVLQNVVYNSATKFVTYQGNSWQGRVFTIPAGTTSVDWSQTDYRAQAAADVIATFTGLLMDPNFNGRTLTLRMFAGGKVNHGSNIILRGAVQAVAATSNDVITFRVIGGTAVETGRNF